MVQILCKNPDNAWGWRDENSLKGYTKLTKNGSGEVISEPALSLDIDYTGEPIPLRLSPGKYKIECWGASGGWGTGRDPTNPYGKGGYSVGVLSIIKETTIWLYIGRQGSAFDQSDFTEASFNGGGFYVAAFNNGHSGGGGGGATDIRLVNGIWNDITSLRSRIMVAGGGGGGQSTCGWNNSPAGNGGGLIGENSLNKSTGQYANASAYGGSQTAGGSGVSNGAWVNIGSFGKGANSDSCGAGGGGGYYGGGSVYTAGGAGGSSFISGHTGCNAINSSGVHTNQPVHYSQMTFRDTIMTQGVKDGDGSVKITLIEPYIFGTYLIRDNNQIGWREFKADFDLNFDISDIGKSIPVNLRPGRYKIELWGAAGEGANPTENVGSRRGRGGYTSGILSIISTTTLYVFIGGSGGIQSSSSGSQQILIGGFNGGGDTSRNTDNGAAGGAGGGATDIRLVNGIWNDITSLRSRIMVAGGGGGSDDWDGRGLNITGTGSGGAKGGANDGSGGDGGGLSGSAGILDGSFQTSRIPPGTQTTGYAFGYGGPYRVVNDCGGGGGGYYGGYGSDHNNAGGAGGSSFISGHTGCNAINSSGVHTNQPVHYSGLVFADTIMTAGVRDGNGNAKITILEYF